MKIVKKIIVGLIVFAVLILIIGLSLPKETSIKRSIFIEAPAAAVFENVNNLKNQEKWDPWLAADKTMKLAYGPVAAGKGASASWTGTSGEGSQTITESVPPSSIKVDLDFKKKGKGKGWWSFQEKGKGVVVTSGFTSIAGNCLVAKYINLFLDPIVGPTMAKGLKKLKEVSEKTM
jgi:hypothetical protein